MRTENSSIPNYPTRTVHVQFQTISCILYSSRFSKYHSRMTLNHQSIKPSVECHKELTKLNTTERTHARTHTHTHTNNAQQNTFSTTVLLLTKWTLLGWDSFLIISVCVALLSSPFRDAGLLGELNSLGEVAGLLPLPAGGLGGFAFVETCLFSL